MRTGYECLKSVFSVCAHGKDLDNGYLVTAKPSFADRSKNTYGEQPLRCHRCKSIMALKLIVHPFYGIIRLLKFGDKQHEKGTDIDGQIQTAICKTAVKILFPKGKLKIASVRQM